MNRYAPHRESHRIHLAPAFLATVQHQSAMFRIGSECSESADPEFCA